MRNQSLWFTAPRELEIREETLRDPDAHEVLVQTLLTAISPGTEMLIYRGEFPRNLPADSTISALQGQLAFPLRYGYCAIGRVRDIGSGVDPSWHSQTVFSFQPHQRFFVVPVDDVQRVPEGISVEDAVFLPNMETAINFLIDGRPIVGEKVVIFGQGIVGLLTAAILSHIPLAHLITVDPFALRRKTSLDVGADDSLDPFGEEFLARLRSQLQQKDDYPGADLVYELTGNPSVLNQAIAVTGFNGRIVIGSWYGNKSTELDLGGSFHRSRITLISSQVSTITPDLSARWSKQRRFATAWDMIRKMNPGGLITHRFDFSEASAAYALLDQQPESAVQVVLQYP